MIIFPSSYSQRTPKISFYFIFPNSAALLPLLIFLLAPIHPAHRLAWLPARGFTTPLGPAAAIQGRKRAVKCLGARASFWRKALAHLGRGRHAKAYLHMLLFHFHTLHANALWKVPSRFPPCAARGEEAGPEWKVPA